MTICMDACIAGVSFSFPSSVREGYIDTPGPSPLPNYNTPIAKFFRKVAENNPQSVNNTPTSRKPKSILNQLQQSWSPNAAASSFSSENIVTSSYGNIESRSVSPDMYSCHKVASPHGLHNCTSLCAHPGVPPRQANMPYCPPASLYMNNMRQMCESPSIGHSNPTSSPMFNMPMENDSRMLYRRASLDTLPVSYPSPTPSSPLLAYPRRPSPLLQNLGVTSALLAAKLQLAKSLLPKLIGMCRLLSSHCTCSPTNPCQDGHGTMHSSPAL